MRLPRTTAVLNPFGRQLRRVGVSFLLLTSLLFLAAPPAAADVSVEIERIGTCGAKVTFGSIEIVKDTDPDIEDRWTVEVEATYTLLKKKNEEAWVSRQLFKKSFAGDKGKKQDLKVGAALGKLAVFEVTLKDGDTEDSFVSIDLGFLTDVVEKDARGFGGPVPDDGGVQNPTFAVSGVNNARINHSNGLITDQQLKDAFARGKARAMSCGDKKAEKPLTFNVTVSAINDDPDRTVENDGEVKVTGTLKLGKLKKAKK